MRLWKLDSADNLYQLPESEWKIKPGSYIYFAGAFTTDDFPSRMEDVRGELRDFMTRVQIHTKNPNIFFSPLEKKIKSSLLTQRHLLQENKIEGVDVYAVSHESSEQAILNCIEFTRTNKLINIIEAERFVDCCLWPSICEQFGLEKLKSEIIEIPSHCKPLYVFRGQSYGSVFLDEVEKNLVKKMKDSGVLAKNIDGITGGICTLATGAFPSAENDERLESFISLNLSGKNDEVAQYFREKSGSFPPDYENAISSNINPYSNIASQFIPQRKLYIACKVPESMNTVVPYGKGVGILCMDFDGNGHYEGFYNRHGSKISVLRELLNRFMANAYSENLETALGLIKDPRYKNPNAIVRPEHEVLLTIKKVIEKHSVSLNI